MENSESRESRKQRFLEAKAVREKEKKNKGNYSNTKTIIPDYKYLYLKPNTCQVFRMVGNPLVVRKEITDPVQVDRSLIIDDEGNYFTLIWNMDKSHPLNLLKRKLTKYSYGKEKKVKIYDNEGCELLRRFLTNGKEKPSSMEQGWSSTRYILANVIDRMDTWCVDNKSTKVFTWKETPAKEEGKFYYEPGMKISFYNEIFDIKCSTYSANFEDFDLVSRRFTEKTRPNDSTNFVLYHPEEKTAIQKYGTDDGIDYYSHIKMTDYLDDEDESLNLFPLEDIPFISRPTPISVVMNKVGNFIKAFDKKYKMNIWEQCLELKGEELEKLRGGITTEGNTEEDSIEHIDADLPSEVQTPVTVTTPIQKVLKKKGFSKEDITSEMLKEFPFIKDLSLADYALITEINVENQEIVWNVPVNAECGNSDCGMDIPEDVATCPYCGTKF
jgi:hypothetical protein